MNPVRYERGGHGGGGERGDRGERGERGDRGERGERGDRRRRKDNTGGGGGGGIILKQRRDRDKDKKLDQKPMMLATPVILGAKSATSTKPTTLESQKENVGISKSGEVIKMISENFEFHVDATTKLFNSDQDDFTVVGVVGYQGVGKSSILNQLAGLNQDGVPLFTPETLENQCMSEHQTSGVDVCALPAERLILLDSQPVMSPSILANAAKLTELPATADVISHENLLYVQSLQLLVYMLSVCHIVIIVQEAVPDVALWRLFKSACMLKYNIPDVSYIPLENEQMSEYTADPVIVFNKLTDAEYFDFYESSSVLSLALDKFFVTPKNGKISESEPVETDSQKGNPVPFFLIPMCDEETNIQPSFQQSSDNLRKQIMSFPKKNFAKPISEKEWARNAAKVWEMVKKSHAIHEYNKTLQKMQLFKS